MKEILFDLFNLLSIIKQKLYCNVHNVIYVIDDPKMIAPVVPKIDIRYVKVQTISELNRYKHDENSRKEFVKFKYFLKHGVRIYLAKHNKNIVGYYLLADLDKFKPYLYNNHPIFQSSKRRYYIFHCRTFEQYRGNRIYPYMLTVMCGDVFSENKNSIIFISTSADNIASQKGIEKTGFKKIGALKYTQIGILKIKREVTKDEYSYSIQ